MWDSIRRTPGWDIVHAFGTSVEGWLVLVARRHITSVADMSDEEAGTLGPIIREVSRSLQVVLDCDKTYVVQFAEHPNHPHVHVHVIARARNLPHEQRGPGIFASMASSTEKSISAERMDEIASRISAELTL
ncbi:MAG: HIT domain-containing protein [Ilumatobacteraceae bacterium]